MFAEKHNIPTSTAIAALRRFIEPKAFNIHGMGERTLNKLVSKGIVSHPYDLYSVSYDTLVRNRIVKPYTGSRIASALNADHFLKLNEVIYGLNIPTIGQDHSMTIAIHYGTLAKLRDEALEQDELNVPQEVKDNLADWFNTPHNIEFVNLLINRKVGSALFTDPNKDQPLNGEVWFISTNNTLTLKLRKELVNLGGKVTRTLTAKCSRAVLMPGETHYQEKCYQLGVQVYDYSQGMERLQAYKKKAPRKPRW